LTVISLSEINLKWKCDVCGKRIPVGEMIAHTNAHTKHEVAEAIWKAKRLEKAKKTGGVLDAWFK
jgi:ribosomal protein L28